MITACLLASLMFMSADTADETGIVAARDLERGRVLSADDVRPRSSLYAGWTTQKPMKKGELLRKPAIAPPNLLIARESVEAVYTGDNIKISLPVTPVGNGALGDTVNVRLPNRKRARAVVIDTNTVRLLAPNR